MSPHHPRPMRRELSLIPVAALLAGCSRQVIVKTAPPQPVGSMQLRVDALHRLLDEQWEYSLRTSPEFASILGDKRYNDRLGDYSQAAVDRDLQASKDFLARFQAVDTTGFPEQEALNAALMLRNLRENIEGAQFNEWEMPVTQFGGVHIDLPQLVPSLSFETVKDYDDYVARLKQVPRVFGEVTANMRKGMADGLIPPRILLEQVVSQANTLATQQPDSSPYAV